ncbi:MAG TPA: NIPSNAP family protein [Planctomycetaceae bacterium]|nr:NIPSNAP family protein [Planctomycetaceae bacterium]
MSKKTCALVCGLMCGAVGVVAYSAGFSQGEEKAANRVYELRTYTTEPGRLPALNARFRDHTMRLFEKHGIRNVMYWVPVDEKLKDNTLIYVVSHASLDAAKKSWDEFVNDAEWKKARDESEKDGKIVSKVDRQYMTLTDYSPAGK